MARERQVTRTVITTELRVLCLDISTTQTEVKTLTITGTIPTQNHLERIIKAKIETPTLKPVHIQEAIENETLYGMTEEHFIKLATILPPRGQTPPEQ